jgi:hypothetical protein
VVVEVELRFEEESLAEEGLDLQLSSPAQKRYFEEEFRVELAISEESDVEAANQELLPSPELLVLESLALESILETILASGIP